MGKDAIKRRIVKVDDREAIEVLRTSSLVDEPWYLQCNPDVARQALDPVEHYVLYGVGEGRNPNRYFDTRWYLARHADVAASGMNPLLHFIVDGAREGRPAGPSFDTAFYLASNPDVARDGINPLLHYMQIGLRQGRLPRHYPFSGRFQARSG